MINSLILYFQFFTRIPIPIVVDQPVEQMKTGVKYFSLFGLIIGCFEGLVFLGLIQFFSYPLSFVLILFFDVLLTGGFHLDALADMADGLFSSQHKERMLEIMKDSRIGSNGVLALIFYYLILIISFYSYRLHLTPLKAIFFVCGMSLIGKSSISLLFYNLCYAGASDQGLGRTFTNVKFIDIFISQVFALLVLGVFFQTSGIIIYFVVLIVILSYRRLVYNKVDGLNGDTLGAAASISQVVYVLTLCILGG
ncbi:adenosylcobinamide-GDP ribazoletransferase [Enterococcus faecalis]|nr:adenosylcobinamide-GDP ribazoletransferase [Enterococcus faecalis]